MFLVSAGFFFHITHGILYRGRKAVKFAPIPSTERGNSCRYNTDRSYDRGHCHMLSCMGTSNFYCSKLRKYSEGCMRVSKTKNQGWSEDSIKTAINRSCFKKNTTGYGGSTSGTSRYWCYACPPCSRTQPVVFFFFFFFEAAAIDRSFDGISNSTLILSFLFWSSHFHKLLSDLLI
jgi:hypothetical protein